jgi:hypothetical protein
MSHHRLFAVILLLAAVACAVYNYTDLFKDEEEPIRQKKQYRYKMPEAIDEYQGEFDSIYDTEFEQPGCGEDWAVWDDQDSGFSEDLRY